MWISFCYLCLFQAEQLRLRCNKKKKRRSKSAGEDQQSSSDEDSSSGSENEDSSGSSICTSVNSLQSLAASQISQVSTQISSDHPPQLQEKERMKLLLQSFKGLKMQGGTPEPRPTPLKLLPLMATKAEHAIPPNIAAIFARLVDLKGDKKATV